MRIRELRLIAFGGFEGTTLDVSAPGLHVVFGRNEAGKSTTLRALSHLLYGIPVKTADAYKHGYEALRIGATLEDDGKILDVVRKKGRSNTLLDPKGGLVDEAALKAMLHGVSEEVFHTTFGLDHDALQRGARALLEGKGDLGESLFQAGLGGSELHRFLVELRGQADAVFSPSAKVKPLNEALRAFSEAQRAARDASATPEGYVQQQESLVGRRADKQRALDEKKSLLFEKNHVARLLKMLPLLRRRDELAGKRAAQGEVVILADDARRDRLEAARALAEAKASALRLEGEVAEIVGRLPSGAPDALADAEAEMEDLAGRLAVYRKSSGELPRARAELQTLDAELSRRARAVGTDARDLATLAAPAASVAAVKTLAAAPARLEAALRAASRAHAEATATLAARGEGRPSRSDRVLEAERAALRRMKQLGLEGDLEAACELALPSPESVEAFAKRDDARAKALARAADREADLSARLAEVARELDALQRAGAVPTEADLRVARDARDALWRDLRAKFAARLADEYERARAAADELADRLRRETERVTTLAKLLAERTARTAELTALREAIASRSADEATQAAEWRALWAPSGVRARTPDEMRGWLARHAQLVEARDQLRAAEREERAEEARQRESAERDLARFAREVATADGELGAWRAKWDAAIAKLGMAPGHGVDEALAVIDALAELQRARDAAEKQRGVVALAEEENAQTAALVRALSAKYAPELAGAAPAEAGAELASRFARARDDRAKRRRLEEQLDEKRAATAEHAESAARAELRLAALTSAARVTTLAELELAEQRSVAALALARDEEALEAQLLDKAEGVALADLAREAAETSADALQARVDEVDARLGELEEEIERLMQQIASIEAGLAKYDRDAGAAAHAAEAQEALARARQYADRWVRVRLAESILSREIQRYREQHQGPLLRRASELFARLTRRAYVGLRSAFDDDRAVLRAARETGQEVPVEGLSDGARDQLYLALRIASLERHAQTTAALPLVVDDVLIHFDDDRARAAIEVLAELSQTLQVLFFTHHQRLVDLARAAVPKGLTVHELGRPPATQLSLSV